MMDIFEYVKCANCGEILKCISDKEGECIWNCGNDDDPPTTLEEEATVQQEEVPTPDAREVVESLEKPLTDEQALMISDLFHSHCCMLEHQVHMSFLLVKLTKSLNPTSYYMILKACTKPTHQVTLPDELKLALKPPTKPPKPSRKKSWHRSCHPT